MPKPIYTGEKPIKQAVVQTAPPDKIKSEEINIQSLLEAHLFYVGKVSGRQYEWKKAGDTVSVLPEDVPELLEKQLGGRLCCGNQVGNKIFQIVSAEA